MTPSTRNVTRAYRTADAESVAAGLRWYRDAHALAVSLDPEDPRRAAGVIAALSPQTSWTLNTALAVRAYRDGYASGTLGASCRKASAILAGEDPADVLGGHKVRAFFALIADPTDADAVCVDRHAIDIALGKRTSDATRPSVSSAKAYGAYAECYRRAAEILGVLPWQVQAVTWEAWRKRHAYRRAAA